MYYNLKIMKYRHSILLLLSVFLFVTGISGQTRFPSFLPPQPAPLLPPVTIGSPHEETVPISQPENSASRNQAEIFENDRREIQLRNARNRQIINEIYRSEAFIRYELPSREWMQGTEFYRDAAGMLSGMLRGDIPVNIKDAVFTVENAYFGNTLDRNTYDKAIGDIIRTAREKAKEDRHDWNNPVTRNIMLFRAMSDTLRLKNRSRERTLISYPFRYDFEDTKGEKEWSKMFVNKLLATRTGQCHSLPLLYLILCEETGTEAFPAYSPSHMYVKFRDNTGTWHNLELTNGRVVSDAFIAGSGFITAEAIKNGTYMSPQSRKQTVAQCLADLAMGYSRKFGFDGFTEQCTDSILKYDPENLSGWVLRSNYLTLLFDYTVRQAGRPHPEVLKTRFPRIYDLWQKRDETYRRIDSRGFREIPQEIYETWRKNMVKE